MPTYETVFITPPNLSETDEQSTVDALAQIVHDGGGTMIANDRMGRRRLAYVIGKFEDGVYTRFLYDAESAVPKELERRIRLSDKVLRSLTVHLEEDWAADAKVEAEREAVRRVEAAARAAEEAAAAADAASRAEAAPAPEVEDDLDADADDERDSEKED